MTDTLDALVLPITREELIRLRNAGKITFDKQVCHIIDWVFQAQDAIEALRAERDALRAEVAALRKDAARIMHFFQMARTPPDDIDTWRAEQDAEIAAIAAMKGAK